MRRRAKTAKAKERAPRDTEGAKIGALQKRLTEALRREAEALAQQAATSEILRVISRSPTDVQSVLDAVAENAARLCHVEDVSIIQAAGGIFRVLAHRGAPRLKEFEGTPVTRGSVAGRAILDAQVVHVHDVTEMSAAEYSVSKALVEHFGHSTMLAIPLLHEGASIGAIFARRTKVQPFSDREIELLQTFANQAVIAIENVRLFTELQASNHELTEALEQQTATAEILRVISASPTAIKPVLDTVARTAARLCDAVDANIHRLDGTRLRIVAHFGPIPLSQAVLDEGWPLDAGSVTGRAIVESRRVHVEDLASAEEFPVGRDYARRLGHRTTLAVPLLRRGAAIGAIVVRRELVRPFTESQIGLLQTFADQAVIAIENVRLFTELQTSNLELTAALDTQTATSDILRVISRTQTDVEPVFHAIVDSAQRLLHGHSSVMSRIAGDRIELAAYTRLGPTADTLLESFFPVPLDALGRPIREIVIGERVPYNVADTETDPRVGERGRTNARARGYRSQLVVPMLRGEDVIGTLAVTRAEAGAFTDDEIALLQTFADQAVIAIENVRLFTELQTSNHELTTALETQTATSDILRVISRSQTDLQPVFDAIANAALRLCGANSSIVTTFDGELLYLSAEVSITPEGTDWIRRVYPLRPSEGFASGRAILRRAIVAIPDVHADARFEVRAVVGVADFRSILAVPMLRDGAPIGTINVHKRETGPFTDSQVELLKTFADQAVIAIENARLLTELQTRTDELTRSVGELTALGDVGRALSSTLDLEAVLKTIVLRANELAGTAGCTIWEYDDAREEFRLRASDYPDEEDAAGLQVVAPVTTIRRGVGVTGQVMARRQPVQIHDIAVEGAEENPIRQRLIAAGHRSLLAVPLLREGEVIGVLVVTRKTLGEFQSEIVQMLSTFATQSALAIQNARLFREIEIKSRELEVVSQHKSEFLASMSHELRTPLNAIIGFSDVLLQGMFGEMSDKQTEYLRDILSSGQHLLSLINDILDLSKIEAGRMELDLADFHLPSAIDDALLLMRERASRRGLTLERHVDEGLADVRADARKVKQVLLNLLSNAVKFTPEGGRIDVRAAHVDGTVEISVTDTGVGIAPEDQEAVFEEFRQVGKSDKKAEGTGLGLALCRKFVELHGGRIWVESAPGEGSTFTFALPAH